LGRTSDIDLTASYYAFAHHNYSIAETARALGIAESSVRRRITLAKDRLGLEPTPEELAAGKLAAKESSVADETALLVAREEARRSKARARDVMREMSTLQAKLDDMELAARSSAVPADWTYTPRRGERGEHMPYLLTSDFQVGEVIDPHETEHGYGYDTEIFRERYKRLVERTIYLSFEHVSEHWHFPGIIYARGGDAISGGIHEELRETDDLTPIQAVEVVFEEEAAGIRELKKAFGRVDVKEVFGNHGRIDHKPQSKRSVARNYEYLIGYMLRREFAKDDAVTFQTTKSPDVYFPIYDMNILLTHGDKIGSRGGQGFIGPAATIIRGAQKVIQEQGAIGRDVDRVDMGHFHTPVVLDWVICNGCLPGYSEYAKMNRLRPSKPQQFLLFHHPRHGVVDYRPINLVE
jgi:transposase-like protein